MSAVRLGLRVMRRGSLVACLTAAVAAAHNPPIVNDPVFVPRKCPATAIAAGVDTSWIRCGTVTVPQNRDDPTAKKLAPVVLSVVVYEAPSAKAKTPLVFLAGGPGEPAIDVVREVFLPSPVGQLTLRDRPIIAFNQRGFGDSSSGASPILGTLAYHWRATRDESIETLVDSAHKIVARLRATGIQPQYFTTPSAAAPSRLGSSMTVRRARPAARNIGSFATSRTRSIATTCRPSISSSTFLRAVDGSISIFAAAIC